MTKSIQKPFGEFTVLANYGQARAAEFVTAHGIIKTPTFVPCATHGSLRSVDLRTVNVDLLLANAYHLYLRPGIDTIEQLGGLHQFMGYDKPIITDSGGFQAFALGRKPFRSPQGEGGRDREAGFARYSADGIQFRSHLDGSLHDFTPELVIDIQQRLGVDIATCLDVCTGFPATEADVARAVSQTTDWAKRSIERWKKPDMLLYGMVQGSIYPNLRERAVQELMDLPFSGYAIGGNMYTFGETINELAHEKPKMWNVVEFTTSLMPADKPRHLLGVGEPVDLIEGVRSGVDTFDCVMATRIARHGSAWVRVDDTTWDFDRLDFHTARFANDTERLDPRCACTTCTGPFQRGYLRHLLKAGDPLVLTLLSIHNVHALTAMMAAVRQSILEGKFAETFPQRHAAN